MKTRLSLFCRELDAIIRPILVPVELAVDLLGDGAQHLSTHRGMPVLRDAHLKVHQLLEKISREQAYVLIFGPLKSGKSTLMNALTGAYVSEVTSLPAYPCLVYLSHGETCNFSVTCYDGSTETLRHPEELRERIEAAHGDLAEQIRDTDDFDPALHFPAAIRKIEVKMPAGNVKESGAVLVDTPGLYSRMKFGYDQMTRDFRDTAACAVFVVKTDNLFLDQVFSEFHELLKVFGRIFLVVNLDSTKQDLQPDGSLQPSLESENPQRIIEAFEKLAMSAPVKEAAEAGRLKIYPIDLLQAASYRLRERSAGTSHDDRDRAKASAKVLVQTGFEALRRDMSEYLDSSEYYRTFVDDSLRYAAGLLTELRRQAENDEIQAMSRQVADLENERRSVDALNASLERLLAQNWQLSFAALEEAFATHADRINVETVRGSVAGITEPIGDWFANDHSLESLMETDYRRHLDQIQRGLADSLSSILTELVSDESAGLGLDDFTRADLAAAGLRLEVLRDRALVAGDAAARDPEADVRSLALPLSYENIPVRKAVLDWVLLRGQTKLRGKLFGPASAPTETIPSETKERQLGQPGREHLLDCARQHLQSSLPTRFEQIAAAVLSSYRDPILEAIEQRTCTLHAELAARVAEIDDRLDSLGGVAHAFGNLADACQTSERELGRLQESYRPPSNPVPVENSDALTLG